MASSKVVSVYLSLKDRFTSGFKKFNEAAQASEKETRRLQNRIRSMGESARASFTDMAGRSVKAIGAMSAAVAGLAVKTGISEALDLEGYRMQLQTATKDTKEAARIMQNAVDMANKTPFEAGELVEAAAKFESMGMSADKWLTLTGDMAAATNKSFDQATEALIDAQTGELERLKEFGITKAMIADKAEKMFTDQQIINNQGQIVNQEKFNEALIALMKDKYAGGMEAQAETIKGVWSTVTGVMKSGLATIMGMSSTGTLRKGSVLDLIKEKVQEVAATFERWQTDGTIDRWAASFDSGLQKVLTVAVPAFQTFGKAVVFIKDALVAFAPLIAGVWFGFQGFTIISRVTEAIKMLRAGMGLFNLTLLSSPLFLIPALIGTIIGILTQLGVDWGAVFTTIVNWVQSAWDKFTGFIEWMKGIVVPSWISSIRDMLQSAADHVQALWDKFSGFMGWLRNISPPSWLSSLGSKISSAFSAASGKYATGTSYFKGGWATINEGGRGEQVILPSGTQIIPHDVAKRRQDGTGGNISVNVQVMGNVIGNSDFANYIGRVVSKQVIKAVNNR